MDERNGPQADAERFRNFMEARSSLAAASHKVAEQFDKAVMALAAGGLSVSLLFVEKIAPHPKAATLWCLAAGWVAFAVSLMCVLFSFLFGYHSFRREIESLNALYRDPSLPIAPRNKLTSAALLFNWLSAIALVIGAVAIVVFAIMNPPAP
jgi:hypothetical protein